MKYAVQWERRAIDALGQLWLDNSALRAAITEAVATTDERLEANPLAEGESRENDRRIAFVPPLVVIFRVIPTDRCVRVLNVRLIRRRDTTE